MKRNRTMKKLILFSLMFLFASTAMGQYVDLGLFVKCATFLLVIFIQRTLNLIPPTS